MTMTVEEQVLGLEVSIDDVLGMQILQRQRDFCGVELCDGIWEALSTVSNTV